MIYYIQIGLFSLLILALVYFNMKFDINENKLDHTIFKALVLSTALVVVLDVLMYLLPLQQTELFIFLNKLVTCSYYILNPIPCLFWFLYADLLIFNDETRFKKIFIIAVIPTIILGLVSIMSLFNGFFFYIDAQNQYYRGAFNWTLVLACYLYLGYTFIMILRNRKNISSKDFLPMLFFLLPPTFGGLIQIFFFGTSVLWMSVTFSILVIYTKIQNVNVSTDYLTGLYNRRQLDTNIRHFNTLQSSGLKIAGMMIDLNDMKTINDSYGHPMGDIALEQTALILKNSFQKDDFIARYGGDEFVVIFMVEDYESLAHAVFSIESNIESFNQTSEFPFTLSFSIGYDLYETEPHDTIDDFIKYLDHKMYISKQQYHKQHDKLNLK